MSFPQEGKPIRFSRRQATLKQASINAEADILLPDISEWREVDANFDRGTLTLEAKKQDESALLESPTFVLPRNTTVYFSLFVEMAAPCGLHLSLRSPLETVAHRAVFGDDEIALSFRYTSKGGEKLHLILAGYQPGAAVRTKIRIMRLMIRAVTIPSITQRTGPDPTYLPHWSKWHRSVHYLCVRSRWINAAVATWELQLGREEALSLPQYMAICPTGQCNASCGFCSVTTNRTGIIKKQLPFEALDRFLSPVFGSLRLFGLEGNGEPTLYDRFDELLFRVTSRGAAVYLISNGERLTADQIALLLAAPTATINFSLNAATAETHQRVMKLKGWDDVVRNISRFVRWRGDANMPLISVSIVVTHDNAHEVQQFLHFAEWQLKVDRILIRPLSEIANDSGVIEDLRELVPYESQINDMLDAVAEYLEFVPRRAEIVIDPTAFNAFRQVPRGLIVAPPGFDDQLLAPRRIDWIIESEKVKVRWQLNRLELSTWSPTSSTLARSRLIPVAVGRWITFRCRALTRKGTLEIAVVDEAGNVLGRACSDGEKARHNDLLAIKFLAPSMGGVSIELRSDQPSIESTIDFGQLHSRSIIENQKIKLPHKSRWQVDNPDTITRWDGNELVLEAQAQPGLYLYRSYMVSTLPEEPIRLTMQVVLEQGALGIGILSDDGKEWLICERFESAKSPTEIAFNSGKHTGFQVVLYTLTEETLRARIDWGDNLEAPPIHQKRLIEPRQLVLPTPDNWIADASDTQIQWVGNCVKLAGNGRKHQHLLHSQPFPCHRFSAPGAQSIAKIRVTVKKGILGIGFQGEESEKFISSSFFSLGEHHACIETEPFGQKTLALVVFAGGTEPLEAEIDWKDMLNLDLSEARHNWKYGSFDPRLEEVESESPLYDPGTRTAAMCPSIWNRASNIYARAGLTGIVRKGLASAVRQCIEISLSILTPKDVFNALLKFSFPNAKIYCQKPWTDLNNFTVDGRMDVCCITTGPSQERYALGNIFKQDFQEIWNGARMKEFRRTVNAKDKLPPCTRCPMANNYRPPF